MAGQKLYTEADLVSFGRFMVSDERRKNFKKTKTSLPLKDRLSDVHHADVCNWKDENNKK